MYKIRFTEVLILNGGLFGTGNFRLMRGSYETTYNLRSGKMLQAITVDVTTITCKAIVALSPLLPAHIMESPYMLIVSAPAFSSLDQHFFSNSMASLKDFFATDSIAGPISLSLAFSVFWPTGGRLICQQCIHVRWSDTGM